MITSQLDNTTGNFSFDEFPTKDGWYRMTVLNMNNVKIDQRYCIHKCGLKIKIYIFGDMWQHMVKEYVSCNITKKIINTGRTEIQDIILQTIREKSPDAANFFCNSINRISVITNDMTELLRGGSNNCKRDGRRKPKASNVFIKGTGGLDCENGMVDLIDFKDRYIAVKGYIQSGKSAMIVSAATWFAMNGKHSFIVLRNSTDDEKQFTNRVKEFNEDLQNKLGGMRGQFEIVAVKNSLITTDMLKGYPKIFICIGNSSPIRNVNQLVKENTRLKLKNNYIVFIDEVDFQNGPGTSEQLGILKENAYCVFGVSGTVMDTILQENIKMKDLIIMGKPTNYVDFASFKHHIIPDQSKLGTFKKDNMLIKDPNLHSFLEWFVKSPLEYSEHYAPNFGEWHPRDYLLKVTTTHDSNRRLLSHIAEKYPAIPTMFFSGNGSIDLHLQGVTIPITLADGHTSVIRHIECEDTQLPGVFHCFKETSPAYVKQWLYENGGYNKYPRIMTLAADMAARAIGFGASNFADCKKRNKLWWHLTGMYVLIAEGTDQAEIQQICGRLCTCKEDPLSMHLHSTKKVCEDLAKASRSQDELINNSLDALLMDKYKDMCIKNVLPLVKIANEKISKRKITKKDHMCITKDGVNKVFKPNTVSIEEDIANGGLCIEEYSVKFEDNDEVMNYQDGDCKLIHPNITTKWYKKLTEHIEIQYGNDVWVPLTAFNLDVYKKIWNLSRKKNVKIVNETNSGLLLRTSHTIMVKYK
jgi:hypothetical protein